MLPILPAMDAVGYRSLEAWGGATFDTCLRFLDENPWERLRTIKDHCPKTPLQMLLRGQNLVGYHHYSDEIVGRFVRAAKRNGIDIFRVFDALNDIRNVRCSARAIKDAGGHFQGAISYTISPVHTIDSYVEYALQLKELGADSIAIKDMAGMLTPFRTERMVKVLVEQVGLPVQVHCHYIGGMAPMNYLKAVEAGAEVLDTAVVALAFGNSQPAVETIVAALKESPYDTGIELDALFEIAHYWEDIRERHHVKRGTTSLLSMEVFSHQVPGGMMSNLLSQLEIQRALDRLPDVLREIAKVRAEVGYPPLVTPMSQIVGTQAVLNVITGKRWSIVPQEMRDYLLGYYGKAPAKLNQEIMDKVLGPDDVALDPDIEPGSLVTTTYDDVAAEIGELARSEEDVLMYALFPKEAREYLERHAHDLQNAVFMTADEARVVKEEIEGDDVNIDQIKELVKTLESSNCAELIVEEGESRVTLRKPGAAPVVVASGGATAPVPPTPQPPIQTQPEPGTRPATWQAVKSPMVGTFYAAPSPDAEPFVAVGDEVKEGQTVCIVEAMKLMNEVSVPVDAVIREVAVTNADAVEYDQALIWFEAL
jgi:oxaloacetate decarboxylase alpha subunit